MAYAKRPAEDRFWEKVAKTDSCWLWTAGKDPDGYGIFRDENTRSVRAHRWIYEQENGPILNGLLIRHTCDTPACIRLDHLIPGTHKDNKQDSIDRNRHSRGEIQPKSKLTWVKVAEIRARYTPAITPISKLAKEYGVSTMTIRRVIQRKNWVKTGLEGS